ncbi:MAG TPA: prepilin-type N-terminal cleavage/methylation domain-containing protein [Candidatus Saccharimonadales bacterium]|nr:prepilin-type N-terminal cleavage/methylation domain-containing protein [Candidatus Saccharimonadales bacterium]
MKKTLLRFHRNCQSGFTLVELLLVMALFAMLLTALTDMFVSTMNVRSETAANSSVTEDGRFMLSRIAYDINRASSITTPASLGASSSILEIVVDGVTFTYELVGGNLQLTDMATGSNRTNNLNSSETTVSAVSFQRLGNASGKDTIRLSFTLTSTTEQKQGYRSETFTTTVGRR